MRNVKSIILLLFAIAALAFANALVDSAGSEAAAVRRASLVDAEADVSRLALARRDGARTELKRENGCWRIVAPYEGRADERVVLKIVDAVSSPLVQDVVSEAELLKLGRRQADFSLDVPNLTLTLGTEKGEVSVSFGATTPSADGVYAALAGVDGVFVVAPSVLKAVDQPIDGFRRRALLASDGTDVSGFDIRSKSRAGLAFVRGADGWTVTGERTAERAAKEKIEQFIGDLFSTEARRFVWPTGSSNETGRVSVSLLAGYGLDAESATTVTLTGMDGSVERILFGKEAGDGLVYALVQNGSAIVTVPATLKDIVEKASDAFTDSRLFPVDLRSVNLFTITSGNVLYALSRDVSGLWRIDSPIAAPAEQKVAETVLTRLLQLTSADVVSEGGIQVSVATNAAKVSVAPASVLENVSFEDFRSREMLRIDAALVTRLVRQEGTGRTDSVVYVRDRRVWNVEKSGDDALVDSGGVEAVVSAIGSLNALRVERLKVPASGLAEYGLDVPVLTIAVDQSAEDSVRRNILIGRKTAGGRFATVGSSDAVFVISDEQVRVLSAPIVTRGNP